MLFLLPAIAARGSVTVRLAWDPNPENNIAGYRIYYGEVDAGVVNMLDVGPQTTGLVTNLPFATPHFFYVTAYNVFNLESDPSEIIQHTTRNRQPLSLTTDTYLITLTPTELVLPARLGGDLPPGGSLAIHWQQLDGPETVVINAGNTLSPRVALATPGSYMFAVRVEEGSAALQSYIYLDAYDRVAGQNPYLSPPRLDPPLLLVDGLVLSWSSKPDRYYHVAYKRDLNDAYWLLAARNLASQGDQTFWVDYAAVFFKQQGFFTVFEVP